MSPSRSHRVLVADDDTEIRKLLKRFLSDEGYVVETAADGKAALALLRGAGFDLLLLDITMPELNGIEVLRQIIAEGMQVGVIMISGYQEEDACRMSLELGAADFIAKPFNLDYLKTSLLAKLVMSAPESST